MTEPPDDFCDPVDLTRALVRCASVTPMDAGAQDVLERALRPLGFICTRLDFNGVPNLFARLGAGRPHLCFAGHTDVVPPGEASAWTHPPFEARIVDGYLYGRGVSDMKGGIGAFTAAVCAFLKTQASLKGSLSFLITGDEEGPSEDGTRRVLEWMACNGHIPDACLVGEPTNPEVLGQEVKIGRRGSLSGVLTVTGKQGHVAYPHLADNPVPRLIRLLDALRLAVLDQGSAHFQPSNIEITGIEAGGIADNVIPARAQAQFNVRFSDRWTEKTLCARLHEILDRVDVPYDLSLRCGAASFLSAPGDFARLLVRAVADVTGRTPVFSTKGGTSDARFIQRFCPVAEFGLTNATAHHVDERASSDDIRRLSDIYRRLLEMYFTAESASDNPGAATRRDHTKATEAVPA